MSASPRPPLPLAAEARQLASLTNQLRSLDYEDLWYLNLLAGLGQKTLWAYATFWSAHEQVAVNDAAWQARNLLELHIWTRYVLLSKESARRFYEDGWVDSNDLLKAFSRHPGHEAELENAKQVSTDKLQCLDLVSEDDKFLKIGVIAEELGIGAEFQTANKWYSKFVHVTAFSVIAEHATKEVKRTIVDSFEQGTTQTTRETLSMLIKQLDEIISSK